MQRRLVGDYSEQEGSDYALRGWHVKRMPFSTRRRMKLRQLAILKVMTNVFHKQLDPLDRNTHFPHVPLEGVVERDLNLDAGTILVREYRCDAVEIYVNSTYSEDRLQRLGLLRSQSDGYSQRGAGGDLVPQFAGGAVLAFSAWG
jgi:hypothetical protein